MLPQFVNWKDPNSLAARIRRRRALLFQSLLRGVPRPLKILDVGGSPHVWEVLKFTNDPEITITLLNLYKSETGYSNVQSLVGDGRDLSRFKDQSFDVVYSNSVIEHIGGEEDRRRMADETRRVGKRYFVQTPFRYFPIEPHFIFPMFQFLPFQAQTWLVQRYNLGWYKKVPDRREAEELVKSIHLLSRSEIKELFQDSTVVSERFGGLVKALLAYRMG